MTEPHEDLIVPHARFTWEEVPVLASHSPGFTRHLQLGAEAILQEYGEPDRPAFFTADAGRVLLVTVNREGFDVLACSRTMIDHIDPFTIRDRLGDRRPPEDLVWKLEPVPPRTTASLGAILQRGDSALLLGSAQALLDGGRLLWKSYDSKEEIIRDLWQLLPDAARGELRFSTYAPTILSFCQLNVVPPEVSGRGLTEEALRDYPEGRYENALQVAVESNDSAALAKLFAQRSSKQTMKLGVALVVVLHLGFGIMKFIEWINR